LMNLDFDEDVWREGKERERERSFILYWLFLALIRIFVNFYFSLQNYVQINSNKD
jgi:hypothetical protein